MAASEVVKKLNEDNVRWVDLQFVDVTGALQHKVVPLSAVEEDSFEKGVGEIDGSSVRGFKKAEQSDLVLVPDEDTYSLIPWEPNTARFFCKILEPYGGGRFAGDCRASLENASESAHEAGYSVQYFGPEIDFFAFDSVAYDSMALFRSQGYSVDSREASWNAYGQGFPVDFKRGTFASQPKDTLQMFRAQICEILEESFGVGVEGHHHASGTAGQCTLELEKSFALKAAEDILTAKFVTKNMAAANALIATFLPLPVYGDNGSSLCLHQSLWKADKNQFYDARDKYAELSQTARYYIGGLLAHGRALAAFTNPTTNSFKRLVGSTNAPKYLAWGKSNRTVAVRVPAYSRGGVDSKRVEYRVSDPSANSYLAIAGLLAAGIDGVKKKTEPGDPVDVDPSKLDAKRKKELGIKMLPYSLEEALDELQTDSAFLKGIIPQELIDAYVEVKLEEIRENALRPTPYEFQAYLGV
ncbi:type I glutamate--ammonia ligase [Candidatus Micrarchaeota archaeon]|nr:type I glutamate--ammonia ligase [Candidatus Micrarchaeota archaeon]